MPPAQAQKEFVVNESLARIDALLHCAVEGVAAEPPGEPAEGECWLVADTPSGAWAGRGRGDGDGDGRGGRRGRSRWFSLKSRT